MSKSKIQVHVSGGAYFLRLWLDDPITGLLCMETSPIYSKPEADFRAITLSSRFGFDRDELPTHQPTEAAPKSVIDDIPAHD